MTGATIVAIIGVLMALVLATRGLRTRRMSSRDRLLMVLVWITIITALAFVLQRSGGSDAFWRH